MYIPHLRIRLLYNFINNKKKSSITLMWVLNRDIEIPHKNILLTKRQSQKEPLFCGNFENIHFCDNWGRLKLLLVLLSFVSFEN